MAVRPLLYKVAPLCRNLPLNGCLGAPALMKPLTVDDLGHQLVAVAGSGLAPLSAAPRGADGAGARLGSLLCLQRGGWSQEKAIKLSKPCAPTTSTGKMILSRFRRGLAPNPRVRAVIERAVPAPRVGVTDASARSVRESTSVGSFSVDSEVPHEARMARLCERVKAREEARGRS